MLRTDADLAEATKALAETCPHMREIAAILGPPPLRWREPGFPGLVATIAAQQLSVGAAKAISERLQARLDPPTPEGLLALDEGELRACGFSGPKIRTLRALSLAIMRGELPFDRLAELSPDAAQSALVKVHGIGPWTAEIYLMFSLGVRDIFAPADLALQEGTRRIMGLEARPNAKEMALIAARWAPNRATAARLLWAWYAHVKRRSGIIGEAVA